jgi:hypothetical protein
VWDLPEKQNLIKKKHFALEINQNEQNVRKNKQKWYFFILILNIKLLNLDENKINKQ